MRPAKRYLRPDTNEIIEVLPGLGDHCFIVGTRKANGSIKRLKTKSLPPCTERKSCQEQLDLYVEFDKNGEWPVVKDQAEQAQAAEDLKAAREARKKWKVGDLVRIRNRSEYDGYWGRIYCLPPARSPNWLYNVELLDTSQEVDSVDCRYDQMEKVEEEDMAKTAVAKRNGKQLALFDYGDAAASDVKHCEKAVERIRGYQRRMAGDIIAIGGELQGVKERLEHGQFGDWIAHYFGWSHMTASRMMSAAAVFGDKINKLLNIDTSALYLLSSDKCPDETREEIIERAEKGEHITHAAVKQELDGDTEPPTYEEQIDKVVAKIRKLASDEHRCILLATLKNICQELEEDE